MLFPIGGNIRGYEQALLAHLASVNSQALLHATRLSTGKNINRPADDPSAYFQLSRFEQQLDAVTTTKKQVDLASNIASQAQLVVDEIRTQLESIRDLLAEDEDGTLTADERATNQESIDVAINTINALAGTPVNGERILDGSKDFSISGQDRSEISAVRVYSLRGEGAVSGTISSAATQGSLTYTGAAGKINSGDATLNLTGTRGSVSIQVNDGDDLSDLSDAINAVSHATGVTASVSGDELTFQTVDYGHEASVQVEATTGTFVVSGGGADNVSRGTDVEGTINGIDITDAMADGNRVTYSSNGTHFTLDFAAGHEGVFSPLTISTSTALKFRLSTDIQQVTTLGLAGLKASDFRSVSGSLDQLFGGQSLAGLGANTSQALRVVDESLGRLTIAEGYLNGFADIAVASSSTLLSGLETTLTAASEDINKVDEDAETVALTEQQLLMSNTQGALNLIQQQQLAMVATLQQLAGLF